MVRLLQKKKASRYVSLCNTVPPLWKFPSKFNQLTRFFVVVIIPGEPWDSPSPRTILRQRRHTKQNQQETKQHNEPHDVCIMNKKTLSLSHLFEECYLICVHFDSKPGDLAPTESHVYHIIRLDEEAMAPSRLVSLILWPQVEAL